MPDSFAPPMLDFFSRLDGIVVDPTLPWLSSSSSPSAWGERKRGLQEVENRPRRSRPPSSSSSSFRSQKAGQEDRIAVYYRIYRVSVLSQPLVWLKNKTNLLFSSLPCNLFLHTRCSNPCGPPCSARQRRAPKGEEEEAVE